MMTMPWLVDPEDLLQKLSNLLETEAGKLSLKINADKTKFIEILFDSQPFKVKNYTFETIYQFKYLETIVATNNDLKVEVNNMLVMSNKYYHDFKIN